MKCARFSPTDSEGRSNNSVCITENDFIHDLSGPNGAGKTTTMKMIIAEEHPTKGRIKIGPYEIESNDSKGFDYLGYCPQVKRTRIKNCDSNFLFLSSKIAPETTISTAATSIWYQIFS